MTGVDPKDQPRPRIEVHPGAAQIINEMAALPSYEALVDSIREAEAIVVALAENPPLGDAGWDGEYSRCVICDATDAPSGDQEREGLTSVPLVHTEACVWRRAVEWLAAHP